MPADVKVDPRRDFVRRIWPWFLGVAMLLVYLLTLNHWVSLLNLTTVAKESGWQWVPNLSSPLYHLVTLPLRILPATAIPLALNLFSAACGALTLGLLARSVAILPHNRTEAQTVRERNDFALLTLRSAWLPALLAVMLCGLQLTFWEMATNGGNEMFDLLLFAFVTWSLLEYRLDGRESRLYWSAAGVGAGMAEGVTMAGFFPLFIAAIVWVRGFAFFNWLFLRRMMWCGLLGFLLFLLFPLLDTISDKAPWPFFQGLKIGLMPQWLVLKSYWSCITDPSQYFDDVMMPLFISLIPLLVLSIRWKFKDSSRIGSAVASLMFHAIHAIFLGVCIWMMFDPPFSPREKGFGLTLYYVIALSTGYYAGYFLLIFGRKHPRDLEYPPISVKLFNFAMVCGIWLLAILAIGGLIDKNSPLVRAANDNSLSQYAFLTVEHLPVPGAIFISDDPQRLFLMQAALTREGHENDYLMLDTRSLSYPQYHRYLHKKWPQKWPLLVSPNQNDLLNSIGLVSLLALLDKTNDLYYLHPSFGYYFEEFYEEPHGLIYELKPLPRDTLLPPPVDKNLIAENEAFWADAQSRGLASVENALAPAPPNAPETLAQKELARLHVPQEQDFNAVVIGSWCSRSLDFWGAALNRAGALTNAGTAFQTALRLNPDNVVAEINLRFNTSLCAGRPPSLDFSMVSALGKFDNMGQAMTEGGPFDEPTFCFQYGKYLAQYNGFYRQAVAPFDRVCQLVPNFLPARFWLAQIYALNRMPDRTLAVLRVPQEQSNAFSLSDSDSTELNMLSAAAYFQKNDLAQGSHILETEISRNPSNDMLLLTVERVYVANGMYSNALAVVNRKLSVTPDDPDWLYAKGYADNQLGKYTDAIPSLNRVLAVQKDNNNALLQRATAYLGSGDLKAARVDYEVLQQIKANSVQVAYGLGEIAWNQHDTNEAIRNFEIYLENAPSNAPLNKIVNEQLSQLKHPAGGE